MKLTVVGPAAAYTQRQGRPSSSYLVEHGDTSIALDFGQGAFAAMSAHRSPDTLNAVFISHLHADHNVDLIPLRHFVAFERDGKAAPALYGPTQLRARFDAFMDGIAFGQFPGAALEPGVRNVGVLTVEAGRVTHIPDSFAFRVAVTGSQNGLVYSGDCGVPDDLLRLMRPTDTLLCEAAWGLERKMPQVHMTAGEAGDVARRGGVKRLVLTHTLDRHEAGEMVAAASDAFGGEVLMAEPGMTLDIG